MPDQNSQVPMPDCQNMKSIFAAASWGKRAMFHGLELGQEDQRPPNLSTNWVKFLRIEFPALTDNPPHREYMRGGQRQRFWRWGGISWWGNEIWKVFFLKAQLFAMEIFKMYSPISVACQSHPCFLLQHFNLSKIGLFTLSQPLKSQSSHPSFNLSLHV